MGTAKPIPMLPLVGLFVPVRIWLVIPTTLPEPVDQRAARVAVVDGGVGLDRVVDLVSRLQRVDLAALGRDDPLGDAAVLAERVADRDHRVAHLHRPHRTERQRVEQRARRGRRVQHRHVVDAIDPDHVRAVGAALAEPDRHRSGAHDDVRVREDVAAAVDDESRSERPRPLLLARGCGVERVAHAAHGGRGHDHHAGGVPAVDLGGVQAGRGGGHVLGHLHPHPADGGDRPVGHVGPAERDGACAPDRRGRRDEHPLPDIRHHGASCTPGGLARDLLPSGPGGLEPPRDEGHDRDHREQGRVRQQDAAVAHRL